MQIACKSLKIEPRAYVRLTFLASYFMENGVVSEFGTHDQLLALGGGY